MSCYRFVLFMFSELKFFFFFFSSRRRHTRCYRDWSSDVCSSDLAAAGEGKGRAGERRQKGEDRDGRSEERRVGKGVDLGGRRIIKKKKKKKHKREKMSDNREASQKYARVKGTLLEM